MGLLNNVIKTVVISALGAKLARGRSPIVAALLTLLATRMMTKNDEPATTQPQPQDGLGGLIEKFGKGGFEDIIRSWIGTGANKPIAPSQLSQALGPDTVDNLSRESGLPREDLLAQLSKLLPDVVDGLTPKGQLPPATDLLPGPMDKDEEPGPDQDQRAGVRKA